MSTNFNNFQEKLSEEADKSQEARNEKKESELEKKQEDMPVKDKAEFKDKWSKSKAQKDKEQAELPEAPDLVAYASSIGKLTDGEINRVGNDYDRKLKEFKDEIERQAKDFGEQAGTKMVSIYNEQIKKAARLVYDVQQDTIEKGKIVVKKVAQTIILQVLGKLGIG